MALLNKSVDPLIITGAGDYAVELLNKMQGVEGGGAECFGEIC